MDQDLKQDPIVGEEELELETESQAVVDEADTTPNEANDEDNADPRYAELKQQAEEAVQRQLRVQADFDNFRRRTLKEKEELGQYASLKLVTQLLPVIDNFGRALLTSNDGADSDSFIKGIDMINRQLWQVLEAEGLKLMEPVGQPFDPVFHQAIMTEASDEYEEGIVIEVVQPGYWLKDKVIRPAMVKVSG